jgi:hypothetical protein
MGALLNQAISDRGGVFRPEEMPEFLYSLWKQSDIDNGQTVKYHYYDKNRRIGLHIAKSTKINAVALTDLREAAANRDHMIINVGLPAIYKAVMDGILADPRNLVGVGNCKNDQVSPVKWESLSDFGSIIKQPRSESRCPIRCYLALLLTRLVFQYSVHHEQGHIVRGHTEFVVSGGLSANPEIDESESGDSACSLIVGEEEAVRSQKNQRALAWQALERDADLWGVTMTLWVNLRISESILNEHVGVDPALVAARREMFGSPEKVLFYVSYALYVSHRIFNPRRWDLYKQVVSDPEYGNRHPHALFRLESVYDILVGNIINSKLYPELKGTNFAEIILSAIAQADRACHMLTQSADRPTGIEIFSGKGTEGFLLYRRMLVDSFEALVPKLRPFVKAGVFP